MKNKNLRKIVELLKKNYPRVKIALKSENPYQLLVATILSAQCTDERVNKVTPAFFKKYKNVKSLASAEVSEVETLIKPAGFYKTKASFLKKSAEIIVKDFKNEVPSSMEELTALPGVSRKTANVVLYNAFGKKEGIAVDTHVKRLSQRLGFTKQSNPFKIERDLMEKIEKRDWGIITLLLMAHGRAVCVARKPRCAVCFLNEICPSASGKKELKSMGSVGWK